MLLLLPLCCPITVVPYDFVVSFRHLSGSSGVYTTVPYPTVPRYVPWYCTVVSTVPHLYSESNLRTHAGNTEGNSSRWQILVRRYVSALSGCTAGWRFHERPQLVHIFTLLSGQRRVGVILFWQPFCVAKEHTRTVTPRCCVTLVVVLFRASKEIPAWKSWSSFGGFPCTSMPSLIYMAV